MEVIIMSNDAGEEVAQSILTNPDNVKGVKEDEREAVFTAIADVYEEDPDNVLDQVVSVSNILKDDDPEATVEFLREVKHRNAEHFVKNAPDIEQFSNVTEAIQDYVFDDDDSQSE